MNTRQQDKQNYEQQHPNSQANPQQDKQNVSQERSSGGYSSQSLDSEKQSRESGSAQSQHYGSSGSNWGGSHSMGGYGGGGRSWAEVVATAEGEGSSKRDCLATILTLSVIPLAEDWIPAYRNPAQQVVRLAVAASTLADRNAVPFLTNQFNNMRVLSDKCLQMTKSMTYIDPNSLGGSCQ